MNVLVVAPMEREARAIRQGVVTVGAGPRAAATLRSVLGRRRCDAVLIAGICGALDPSLKPGDVILSRSVVAASLPEIVPHARLLDAARTELRAAGAGRVAFISSRLLTTPSPLVDPHARRDLWNEHGAAGVDMETYALAETASDRGVPWLAVRAVSDGARARVPSSIASWRDESDDWRIARTMARRPLDWAPALRLALGARAALRSLAVAVPLVVGALERLEVATRAPIAQRPDSDSRGTRLELSAVPRRRLR